MKLYVMVAAVMLVVLTMCDSSDHHPSSHSSSPHFRYNSRHDLYNAIKDWLKDNGGPVFNSKTAVLDMTYIVLSRLATNVPCMRDFRHLNERLDTNVRWFLDRFTNQRNLTASSIMSNESTFLHFCQQLLQFALNFPPCCIPTTCPESRSAFDTDTSLMTSVRQKYNRNAHLHFANASHSLKYEIDAHANRLLCVRDNDVKMSVRPNSFHGDHNVVNEDHHPAVVIFYILQGYNFPEENDPCPIDYLHDIVHHYGAKNGKISSEGLARMLQQINTGMPHSRSLTSFSQHSDMDGAHRRFLPPNQDSHSFNTLVGALDWHHVSGQHNNNNDKDDREHFYNYNFHQKLSFLNMYGDRLDHSSHISRKVCKSASDIRAMFEEQTSSWGSPKTISMSEFEDMCPAIIYYILTNATACWNSIPGHTSTTIPSTTTASSSSITQSASVSMSSPSSTNYMNMNSTVKTEKQISTYKSYLSGSISTLLISLCSLLGAAFMKLSQVNVRAYFMASMLSLAVGCLVADAALHLLPEVLASEHSEEGDGYFPNTLKKMCALLGSVYVFFVLELFLSTKHKHSHGAEESNSDQIQIKYLKNLSDKKNSFTINNKLPETSSTASQKSNGNPLRKKNNTDDVTNDEDHVNNVAVDDVIVVSQRSSNASDRISVHDVPTDLKALAWMIIIGDGIHNFADGLAIGAAFALSFTKGLSISITVLCHEVPHELGDFAVLVSTGMSIKKAMVFNFLSSLTAFAGLYVGLALGAQDEASKWIFSVGAGMFLYVALTDLIPECKEHYKRKPTWTMFIGENVGILLGYATMMLLALYEERLEINI